MPSVITDHPDFELEAKSIDLEKLRTYGLPIIIDFGADSCIPCKEMAPVLKKLNAEMRGSVIVKFVDVWKNGGAADGFPIQVIPTQLFLQRMVNLMFLEKISAFSLRNMTTKKAESTLLPFIKAG